MPKTWICQIRVLFEKNKIGKCKFGNFFYLVFPAKYDNLINHIWLVSLVPKNTTENNLILTANDTLRSNNLTCKSIGQIMSYAQSHNQLQDDMI